MAQRKQMMNVLGKQKYFIDIWLSVEQRSELIKNECMMEMRIAIIFINWCLLICYNLQIEMLEQLLVGLQYPFTANCANCMLILFEVSLIDQFIKTRQDPNHKFTQDTAKYYMLHQGIVPSSFSIDKIPILNKTYPFFMLFNALIKCTKCTSVIGCKLISVSSDIPNHDLLNRLFIDISKVKIRTLKEDVTQQVTSRFYEQWDNDETENDSLDLSEKKVNKEKKANLKAKESHSPKEKKERDIKQKQNITKNSNEIKHLRTQLDSEKEENKEIVKEIVSSIDFFNELLSSLEKRVTHTEAVYLSLKDKIQKISPLLKNKKTSQ